MKTPEYRVTFSHNGREVTFSRYEADRDVAIESAKHGFQFCYGYWPEDPIGVEELGQDPQPGTDDYGYAIHDGWV